MRHRTLRVLPSTIPPRGYQMAKNGRGLPPANRYSFLPLGWDSFDRGKGGKNVGTTKRGYRLSSSTALGKNIRGGIKAAAHMRNAGFISTEMLAARSRTAEHSAAFGRRHRIQRRCRNNSFPEIGRQRHVSSIDGSRLRNRLATFRQTTPQRLHALPFPRIHGGPVTLSNTIRQNRRFSRPDIHAMCCRFKNRKESVSHACHGGGSMTRAPPNSAFYFPRRSSSANALSTKLKARSAALASARSSDRVSIRRMAFHARCRSSRA